MKQNQKKMMMNKQMTIPEYLEAILTELRRINKEDSKTKRDANNSKSTKKD